MTDIKFTEQEIQAAREYARNAAPETYQRLSGSHDPTEHTRRNRVGKLGELAFYRFLLENGRQPVGADSMLIVWEGETNVDRWDFQTADGRTIDIKTASRNYHRLIIVPQDQFENQRKDYYVGVRISENEKSANVRGYATRQDMQESGIHNRGEGLGYERSLQRLRPISELLAQFPRRG